MYYNNTLCFLEYPCKVRHESKESSFPAWRIKETHEEIYHGGEETIKTKTEKNQSIQVVSDSEMGLFYAFDHTFAF